MATRILRSRYQRTKGLRGDREIYLRKPYTLVLRRIIHRRIGVWALPEAFCNTKAKLAINEHIVEQNKRTPTDLKNLSGLIFVFCGSIFALTGRRGRRPLQEISNILMRRSLSGSAFSHIKQSPYKARDTARSRRRAYPAPAQARGRARAWRCARNPSLFRTISCAAPAYPRDACARF